MALVFDIETDGLLETVSKIHSLVLYDTERETLISCASGQVKYRPIEEGLTLLSEAQEIVGHNIMKYDIPALKKLFPGWKTSAKVLDTLVCSRLIWPEMREHDMNIRRKGIEVPGKLIGRHSLEAWGYRLGVYKGEYGKTTSWAAWDDDMQRYCEQDVRVTVRLLEQIKECNYSPTAIELEHQFQEVIINQEQFGFCFDVAKAKELYAKLCEERISLARKLREVFPPLEIKTPFTPKVNNATRGYVKGQLTYKVSVQEFNPNSRTQIAERLKEKYGWEPTAFTSSGQPEVSEDTLKHLQWPEAELLCRYLMLQKRIGQIAEGDAAWLKCEVNGRIHGELITNGAVTGRCTHRRPNIAQVPAVGVPFGEECRALFGPPPGWVQVGCDASGLELRCLAHYMARYDGGAYGNVVLHGDIHTENQKAAGLATRAEAKRFIYAFLYGAGNQLLGSILAPDDPIAKQNAIGKRVRMKFLNSLPALKRLIETVQDVAKSRGYLKGLDGRFLPVRSAHSALNLLLQSAGALAMKQATVFLWEDLEKAGLAWKQDVAQVAHIHDEYQLVTRPELAEQVGQIGVGAIKRAGEHFRFRCPLDGEYKIGKNWAETH